jgi:nicotinamidase-related amidase
VATLDRDLLEVIDSYVNQGTKLAGLVIDEQSETIPFPYLPAQQWVIEKARLLQCPVWFVELNPKRGDQKNLPTNGALRAIVAGSKVRICTKKSLNAFVDSSPNLDDDLKAEEIEVVVVMGYHVACCVKLTAVGGSETRGGQVHESANGLGYAVLSSDLVVRGGRANWKDESNVWFCTRVGILSKGHLPP